MKAILDSSHLITHWFKCERYLLSLFLKLADFMEERLEDRLETLELSLNQELSRPLHEIVSALKTSPPAPTEDWRSTLNSL